MKRFLPLSITFRDLNLSFDEIRGGIRDWYKSIFIFLHLQLKVENPLFDSPAISFKPNTNISSILWLFQHLKIHYFILQNNEINSEKIWKQIGIIKYRKKCFSCLVFIRKLYFHVLMLASCGETIKYKIIYIFSVSNREKIKRNTEKKINNKN